MLQGGGGGTGGETAGANKFRTGTAGGGKGGVGGSQVYMGTPSGAGFVSPFAPTGATGQVPAPGPMYLPKAQAYQFINSFSGQQLAALQAKMQLAGMIGDNDGLMEMQAKWKKLVDASFALTMAGQKVSPTDVLDSYFGKGPLGGKGGLGSLATGGGAWQVQYRGGRKFLVNTQTNEVKYEGPRFQTTYDKAIDLTDPVTAKAIATSVFQQLMHRDPGKGELGGFSSALRTAEQQSPVVTQQTTEYDMNTGEPIGTTENRTGGITAEGKQYLAEQRVKKTKEYASTQAATTYMNALEAAIFNNPFGSI